MATKPKVCKRCFLSEPETTFYRTGGLLCVECRRRMLSVILLPIPKPTSGLCPLLRLKRCKECLTPKPVVEFRLVGDQRGVRVATCSACEVMSYTLERLLPPKPTNGLCSLLVAPMNRCSKCKVKKEANLENFRFRFRITAGRPVPISTCRVCDRADALEHYNTKVTPEARRAYSLDYEHSESGRAARTRSITKLKESGWMYQHGRRTNLRLKFGLTPEQVDLMAAEQDGKCAICRLETIKFYVDHNHSTDQIRGLLDINCNAGLGSFYENTVRLFAAIAYLTRPLPLIDRSRSYPVKGGRDERLRGNYNLTLDGYNDLLRRQGGVCAICRGESGKTQLGVDHIHGTKNIRGILCSPCNLALGYFKDNPTTIAAAIWYLHKASQLEIAA